MAVSAVIQILTEAEAWLRIFQIPEIQGDQVLTEGMNLTGTIIAQRL
jgi:hypothetical protein